MPQRVLHQPRVAWDFARVLVSVADAGDEEYRWFSGHVDQLLGPAIRDELYATRDRLRRSVRSDVEAVEAGRWRFRMEDVLRAEPDLAAGLSALCRDAATRLKEHAA